MKRSRITLMAACVGVLAMTIGCASTTTTNDWRAQDASVQRAESAAALVEAPELGAAIRMAGPDLVIFDVRSEADYAAGHLPGAIRIDYAEWEEFSLSSETGLSHEQMWHNRIGAFGVDGDDTVLIYDGGKMTQAARVWFILQHFGVGEARLSTAGSR